MWWVQGRLTKVLGILGSYLCPLHLSVTLPCFFTAVKENTELTTSAILKRTVQWPLVHLHRHTAPPPALAGHPQSPSALHLLSLRNRTITSTEVQPSSAHLDAGLTPGCLPPACPVPRGVLTCSQTILWYTSCLMLISTSNSDSLLSASVLAVRMSLDGETCWGKSRIFL